MVRCTGGPRVSFPDYPSIMRHSLNEPGYGRCAPHPFSPRCSFSSTVRVSQAFNASSYHLI